MWVALAFVSAFFLGFYDVAKKKSLAGNPVPAVLFLNTLFCTLIFTPFIIIDEVCPQITAETIFDAGNSLPNNINSQYSAHILVVIKAFIVLSSWIMGYYALKHLPITITGPINAIRPVLVLVGAVVLFSEKLNLLQWGGVLITLSTLFLLSLSGKKEGIDFKTNKWIFILFGAVLMGAVSGLYDKFIMKQLPPLFVQSWFNIYQMIIMGIILFFINRYSRKANKCNCNVNGNGNGNSNCKYTSHNKLHWSWWIPLISIFISVADFAYYYALSHEEALIAVISMIRRGSVVISFTAGALIFREKNLKAKALDLFLILIGLILLCIGSLEG